MKSFSGKVAAITGAGSGIGRALALNLAAQQCELALSDVNEAGLKKNRQTGCCYLARPRDQRNESGRIST